MRVLVSGIFCDARATGVVCCDGFRLTRSPLMRHRHDLAPFGRSIVRTPAVSRRD